MTVKGLKKTDGSVIVETSVEGEEHVKVDSHPGRQHSRVHFLVTRLRSERHHVHSNGESCSFFVVENRRKNDVLKESLKQQVE